MAVRFRLLMLAMAMVPLAAGAALSASSYQEQQSALRAARERAEAARLRSEQLERQAGRALAGAERAAMERAAMASRVEEAEADLAAALARLKLIDRRQARQQKTLEQEQLPLMRLAAALQILARRPVDLAMMEPRSIEDLVHVRVMLAAVMPQVQERTLRMRQLLRETGETRTEAVLATDARRTAQAEIVKRRGLLADMEVAYRQRALRFGGQAAMEREKALALGEQARDLVEQYDREQAAEEVAGVLDGLDGPAYLAARAARGSAAGKAGAHDAAYRLPVAGARLTSGMGEASEYGFRARGLTLSPPPSAMVMAPAAGIVRFAGPYRSYGRIVILDHGAGWTSLVTGIETLAVERGQRVAAGDTLGQMGAREAQLMVELRRNGRPVDLTALLW